MTKGPECPACHRPTSITRRVDPETGRVSYPVTPEQQLESKVAPRLGVTSPELRALVEARYPGRTLLELREARAVLKPERSARARRRSATLDLIAELGQ